MEVVQINAKYQFIMKKYEEVFYSNKILEPGSIIFNHRDNLISNYNIFLKNTASREILLRLFDEFDAAIALTELSSKIKL